jgi:hypothetical protein
MIEFQLKSDPNPMSVVLHPALTHTAHLSALSFRARVRVCVCMFVCLCVCVCVCVFVVFFYYGCMLECARARECVFVFMCVNVSA